MCASKNSSHTLYGDTHSHPKEIESWTSFKNRCYFELEASYKVETKWIGEVIYHMVEKRRKENMLLPIQSLNYENSGTIWI